MIGSTQPIRCSSPSQPRPWPAQGPSQPATRAITPRICRDERVLSAAYVLATFRLGPWIQRCFRPDALTECQRERCPDDHVELVGSGDQSFRSASDATLGTGTRCRRRNRPISPSTPRAVAEPFDVDRFVTAQHGAEPHSTCIAGPLITAQRDVERFRHSLDASLRRVARRTSPNGHVEIGGRIKGRRPSGA